VGARRQDNQPDFSQLSQGQARYVLEKLISDRRVSPGEVNRYISDMHREITDLESRLRSLREATGGVSGFSGAARRPGRPGRPPAAAAPARRGRPPAAAATAGAKKGRRRAAITAEQLASRQLQGRYLGLIRQIPASKRAQYQRTAKEKGREAAIRDMREALKK
jgi:hypothetical protein